MGVPKFIESPTGEELVLMSREDYDLMLAQMGNDDAEDRMTLRVAEKARAAVAAGDDVVLPDLVWDAIEAGHNAVYVLRNHRRKSQADLAGAINSSQGYVSEIENGKRQPGIEILGKLARALEVPAGVLLELLVPEDRTLDRPEPPAPYAEGGFQTQVNANMRPPTRHG